MNASEIYKAFKQADIGSGFWSVCADAEINVGDTFGPCGFENKKEWLNAFVSNIQSALCDPETNGISNETIQIFKYMGIKA